MSEKTSSEKTVLYIDDDLLNLQLVRRTLSRIGYRLVEAMDAQKGIELAANEMPDLILMDLNMPDIDGFEAVRRIRRNENLVRVPIVMLTADNNPNNPALSKDAGCDGYLQKPIRYSKLVDVIDKFLVEDPIKRNATT